MNYLLKTIMRNLNFLNSDNDNHKSLRVRTNIGDTFLNVNLDQTYESLDILSSILLRRFSFCLLSSVSRRFSNPIVGSLSSIYLSIISKSEGSFSARFDTQSEKFINFDSEIQFLKL